MDKIPFDQMDELWKKRLGNLKDKEVPKELLVNFSASVEEKILAKRELKEKRSIFRNPFVGAARQWTPVFAVLLLASLVVVRLPGVSRSPMMSKPAIELASVPSELAEEISVLTELGVWTEEDERAVSDPAESAFEGLELSKTLPAEDVQIA